LLNFDIGSPASSRRAQTFRAAPAWMLTALAGGLVVHALSATDSGRALAQAQDGRALDRNPQVGSGGRNTNTSDFDAVRRFNDAVIYGNAPGGKSFRGSTASRAPGDFRGSGAAGSSLFNFQRDTAAQGLVGSGVRSSDILAMQFALSAGTTRGEANPVTTNQLLSNRPGYGASGSSLANMRSVAEFTTAEARRPSVLGVSASRGGDQRIITSSPLRGISASALPPDVPYWQRPSALTRDLPGAPADPFATPGRPPTGDTQRPGALAPGRVDLSANPRPVPTPGSPEGAGGSAAEPLTRPGQVVPSRVDSSVPPVVSGFDSIEAQLRRQAERAAQRQGPNTPGATTPAPSPGAPAGGPDTPRPRAPGEPISEAEFGAQMAALRARLKDQPAPTEAGATTNPAAGDATPDWRRELLTPRARDAQLRRDLEKLGVRVPEPTPDPSAEAGKAFVPEPRAVPLFRDDIVLDALRESIANPPVRELVPGDAPTDQAFAALMRNAQKDLSEGRYFDAEAAFDRAMQLRGLSIQPGGRGALAMARAGRLNAQFAAGLLLSASSSLRNLLRDEPAMIAVRFDPSLMMSRERATLAYDQLTRELANDAGLNADGAWLIAYLGFQYQNPEWLAAGFAQLERFKPTMPTPDQRLLEVVRSVWRADISSMPAAPASPAAPARPSPDVNK
jgi:hypothetical protein